METIKLLTLLCKKFRFKSYYVVWKLYIYKLYNIITDSLNRTMQYGNALWEGEKEIGTGSLNRTMQYGNYFRRNFMSSDNIV